MPAGRDSESDGVISGGRRWRPIRGRSRRGYSSGRGGEFYHHQPPTTTRFPGSDLCHGLLTYATPGRAASTRYASTRRTPGSPWPLYLYLCPLPLGFPARKSCGSRAGGRRPRIRVFHARRVASPQKKKCLIRRGRGTRAPVRRLGGGEGGDAERTKGGSEMFVGERGMHGFSFRVHVTRSDRESVPRMIRRVD